MIELGLSRISRLLRQTPLPWRAIHVAGTNGKGSICAAASAMLHRGAGLQVGRFTSPHLLDSWDCVNLNEGTVAESMFREAEDKVKWYNRREDIEATEFEILTATAFEIFTRAKVAVGVVEVGMGGRLDATNMLQNPLSTVIAKIGMDHQDFLGDTIEKIAREKAGILKPGAPYVLSPDNNCAVRRVVAEAALQVGANPIQLPPSVSEKAHKAIDKLDVPPHQKTNCSLAFHAVYEAVIKLGHAPEVTKLLSHLPPSTPGRLQRVTFPSSITGGEERDALIDGAHNVDSAQVLGQYVDTHLRSSPDSSVDWIIALSSSKQKDANAILSAMLRPQDHVICTEFSKVEGMPWVRVLPDLLPMVQSLLKNPTEARFDPLEEDRDWRRALQGGPERPLVVAGSLYLVSRVLRRLRAAQAKH